MAMRCVFQVPDAPKPVFPDLCGVAYDAEIPILWLFQLSEGGRSKADMSWIFLKIPPGISWKFA